MTKYEIIFSDQAKEDIVKHKKSGQKQLLNKIGIFLEEIKEHPSKGTGQLEIMKGFVDREIYSRRINQKHRLVYEILEENKEVHIHSAYGHYNDK